MCVNPGQVCECVKESLCARRGEVKQRPSQKCKDGVKSLESEHKKENMDGKDKILRSIYN